MGARLKFLSRLYIAALRCFDVTLYWSAVRRARTPGDWTLDLLIGERIGDFVLSFFIIVIRSLSCAVCLWTWQHRCEAECRVIE